MLPLRGRILRPIRERHQVLALKRYAKPDDTAAAAVFLASTDAGHTAGHVLSVYGALRPPVCCSIHRTNADEACCPYHLLRRRSPVMPLTGIPMCPARGCNDLLDHLVGAGEDGRRQRYTQSLGDAKVDSKIELRGPFERQITGLCSLQNAIEL